MELLPKIEKFLADNAMPIGTFGILTVGDPNLVRELRGGRKPGAETVVKILDFMLTEKMGTMQQAVAKELAKARIKRKRISEAIDRASDEPVGGTNTAHERGMEIGSRALLKALFKSGKTHGPITERMRIAMEMA